MRFVLALLISTSFVAQADQQTPCTSKCNQQSSDCMKVCTGDPKEAQKPDHAKKLMECVKTCETQNAQCKASCK